MYTRIDELIEAICQDESFVLYKQAEKSLYDEKTMALLSRHQMIQSDYLNMKKYEKYVSNDDLKNSLKEVKKEMMDNEKIQHYYQTYHAFNELLDDVTRIVFASISDELSFDTRL